MGSLVCENCWRWVWERDLDAFLRWEMKNCSRKSELRLYILGLKRLFCQTRDLNKRGIDASANKRLLSRAWRQKLTETHNLVGGLKPQIVLQRLLRN